MKGKTMTIEKGTVVYHGDQKGQIIRRIGAHAVRVQTMVMVHATPFDHFGRGSMQRAKRVLGEKTWLVKWLTEKPA